MGGAARNHGGTRGHGCSPLPGDRPNVNRHTLNDSTIISMVKNKKVGQERQPTDKKLMIVKQLPRIGRELDWNGNHNIISKVMEKKQVNQDVEKVESMTVQNRKDQGSFLKQTKNIKAESPAKSTPLERLADKNLQQVNGKSLEGLNTEPCLKVQTKQCNQEKSTQVLRVAKGNIKKLDDKTKKKQVEDYPLSVPKMSLQKSQQQIDDKIIPDPELDTNPVKQMQKELHLKLPDQQLLHVDPVTLEHEVKRHQGYHAVPQPMVPFPAFQTRWSQIWVNNCLMQPQVSPTLISYPSIPVPFQSGLVQIQLSPVMFIVNSSNQAHQAHQANLPPKDPMTYMPEQD